jgi:K+-sensing histidine kinase KdpD
MSLRHSSSLNNVRQSSSSSSSQSQKMKNSNSSPNGSLAKVNGGGNSGDRERLKRERESIKLWIHPILTIKYCVLEITTLFQIYKRSVLNHKKTLVFIAAILAAFFAMWYIPGKHQVYVEIIRKNAFFVTYWVGLGVISSIGKSYYFWIKLLAAIIILHFRTRNWTSYIHFISWTTHSKCDFGRIRMWVFRLSFTTIS